MLHACCLDYTTGDHRPHQKQSNSVTLSSHPYQPYSRACEERAEESPITAAGRPPAYD
jgi:hypothetical protein